ncbi:hypothetical protein [uncultured Desulfobacter sp.]|uniref:hypothetical protein n=1 Tax=uncultured Desulfobacter sp. TaxID=240139 RepID=UPI0029F5B22C|nr:hypothetical protein [uncultured Desulfobacter sp.]
MMKGYTKLYIWLIQMVCVIFISVTMSGCVSSPTKVDVQLKESAPEVKLTSYTEALIDLGLMTEIFDTGELKIQSDPIGDNTGTSGATGGEIPRDITEILKSALNSIGGFIRYIPYDPAYIQNMNVTGYSDFSDKLIPEVVISGGITEFDRGLETRGDGTDMGVDATFSNAPKFLPSGSVGVNYSDSGKQGLARITLDFNMLDFKTMAGIPRMNTINSMEVHKGLREKEFGITLFGPTFGSKGSIKKVQGRHAAVRVLVEVSMIQMVGKYLALPYWTLLGNDTSRDAVVVRQIKRYYHSVNAAEQIMAAQQWAYLYGHNLNLNGQLDSASINAFKTISPSFSPASGKIDFNTFMAVYENIPITEAALARRYQLNTILSGGTITQPVQSSQPTVNAPSASSSNTSQPKPPAGASHGSSTATSQPKPAIKAGAGIGRMLSEDEW